ncbi:hypothetical protein SNE35_01620 [Paucibacter sp. R3-3]|uniref:Uncharacterized protein n=1 Tax=Roseateles agri TaxID=3098619 RepID=A0ABU5DA74_9BURK|nr:hypothetical protein [Paucibacter sp. R3-3]MDY0743181.1 hypothetical protein [Paucibacter sp. R3-3]
MRSLALLALTLPLAAAAAPDAPPTTPQTVALLAAVGDRVEYVRQLKLSSSRAEPYKRETVQVSNQALNYAVLRGLDKALTDEDPAAQHVLLQWDMPADVAAKMAKARGRERQDIVLASLTEHLRSLPERQGWDRIEVIVPAYSDAEMQGVGTKLSGIGIYLQPNAPQEFDMDGIADGSAANAVISTETEGDYKTVNPRTGETAHSATYVASYMYFERLTYDAKSMALLKRERHFDNTKYADPDSTALDVGSQMSGAALIGKLVESVERSAYKAIRPVTNEVTASEPKLAPISSSAPASGPAPVKSN